jgi:hypothetical protein
MTMEEFKAKRKEIEAEYRDSKAFAGAVREQRLADLYLDSGWTQREIAKAERCSQKTVDFLLRFGRFLQWLEYHGTQAIPKNLSERRFRAYWEKTDSGLGEGPRFKAVAESLSEEIVVKKHHAPDVCKTIVDKFGDWKWRHLSAMAEAIDVPIGTLKSSLSRMKDGTIGMARVETNGDGGPTTTRYRLRPIKRGFRREQVPGDEVAKLLDTCDTLLKEGITYSHRHSAMFSPAYALLLFRTIAENIERFKSFLSGKEQRFHCRERNGLSLDEAKTPILEGGSNA